MQPVLYTLSAPPPLQSIIYDSPDKYEEKTNIKSTSEKE
jgi:hypothetical protein